ncbi:uncharacterized protein [Littorina saxatilis]|uniref:uncharacterized protein n=1 Tax=Littorina saxatilis TaxID=31220 RepID=UPI0038B4A60A
MEHLVHCAVTPGNVPETGCGLYDILIWNEVGNLTFSAVQLHKPGLDAKLSPGAVAGIVVGAIFLLTLLLLAVFCAIKGVKKKSGEQNDQQYRDTARQDSADYENADVPSRINIQNQPQQQDQQRRQQQPIVVQAQPQDASVYQNMPGTHTYNNEGNTYDVLQTDEQDDARTYTGLVTSSRVDSDTYLELVNSSEGDYEIP